MTVSVLIPTFRRPGGLRVAIASVLAQSHRPDEIIIVDNSPEASARCIADNAKAVARCPVIYVHAPQPGVSNARNAGFAAASSRYIAFLDDDEVASVAWLDALLATARELRASVVFGPLRAEIGDAPALSAELATRLYSRTGPGHDERLAKAFGCGNSLVDREAFDLPDAPFDTRLNQTGGEDDVFFASLAAQGARFAWSSRALAVEVVDERRMALKHLLTRSFAFGQGATQNCARAARPDLPGMVFWMVVGLGQAAIYGPLAGLAALFAPRRAASLLDKAVQGAGKLFWFGNFEPKFYGQDEPETGSRHTATPGMATR
tara:strand:- start:11834 stop:12790 length:957 start_codon:yes stop_codon:yes gene_type:complete